MESTLVEFDTLWTAVHCSVASIGSTSLEGIYDSSGTEYIVKVNQPHGKTGARKDGESYVRT